MTMFTDLVLVAFVIAWLRGGRLPTEVPLRFWWLALITFGLQLLNLLVLPAAVNEVVTVVTYGALLVVILANRHRLSIRLMLIGTLLNVVAILANGGRMPIDPKVAAWVGVDLTGVSESAKHVVADGTIQLGFLTDVLPLPFPFPRVISIGDVFLMVGSFLLVQALMGKPIGRADTTEPPFIQTV